MTEHKWTPRDAQSAEYHAGYNQALKDTAAPDLYKALGKMVYLQSGGPSTGTEAEKWLKDALSALAKARGEQT